MKKQVFVFDPIVNDELSKVRGIGRYLQILRENFGNKWAFINNLRIEQFNNETIFINPFFNFLTPPITMRRIAKKQIAIIHDLIPFKYPAHFPTGIKGGLNYFMNKLALKNYDLIVTDSDASKKDIIKILGINENKIQVIYPCLPKIFTKTNIQNLNSKQLSTFNFQLSNSYCLYVGDATWNKNLVNLAKAIKILNVTCVFVGKVFGQEQQKLTFGDVSRINPWQWEFYEFLKETKDDKRFIFLGYINDYELIKLYEHAKVNILISRDEGFGFSYLESSSQSCPSILADIPVLHEIAKDAALFSDPQNTRAVSNAIGEIFFNDQIRKDIGKKAKKRSLEFSPIQFKKRFLEIINKL